MSAHVVLPRSILDTDLYKLTMQQAVLQHFPNVQATYRFTNRSKETLFSRKCVDQLRSSVALFGDLNLSTEDREWMRRTCPYFTEKYLDYLSIFRFNPEQVQINFVPIEDGLYGQIEIEVTGPWVETILYEVPLMATLSETYFQTDETDWSYEGQEELAFNKGKTLIEAGCTFSEFGTRRRRSFNAQDIAVQGLIRASKEVHSTSGGKLNGTSNVHLARKYNITPVGTIAHEWFMGIGALRGYEHVNDNSLGCWEETYSDYESLLIALTDTFSTHAFMHEFVQNPERARKWTGLRQDSGDPLVFGPRVKEVYQSLGIDYRDKLLVYSDALHVDKCLRIKKHCEELGFKKVSFGIGTNMTNDFRTLSSGFKVKSEPLNVVIKIAAVDGKPCVKISDELTKNTGDKSVVKHVKKVFGLPS